MQEVKSSAYSISCEDTRKLLDVALVGWRIQACRQTPLRSISAIDCFDIGTPRVRSPRNECIPCGTVPPFPILFDHCEDRSVTINSEPGIARVNEEFIVLFKTRSSSLVQRPRFFIANAACRR